jgi:serine/alanine adding enzyme
VNAPIATTLPVIRVEPSAPADWDSYVQAHAQASPYHLADRVEIGTRAFGFPAHFLCARSESGRLTGVLPLVEQPGIFGGRSLVSLPFFNYGGILADDARTSAALAAGAADWARSRRIGSIELRHDHPAALAWNERLDKITLLLELPASTAELSKRLGAKLRSQIKRAERVQPEVLFGGRELLDEFYPVFCSVMRDLGTPVYPRHFFDAVFAALGDSVQLVLIRVNGRAASGAILVEWRGRMEIPWAATLGEFRSAAINMRLYWEVLQYAVQRRCAQFDFGRSTRDSGTHRFKEQWGAKPAQLYWHRWPASAVAQPAGGEHDRFVLATRVWSKLPLPVANWLGPRISPRLPW